MRNSLIPEYHHGCRYSFYTECTKTNWNCTEIATKFSKNAYILKLMWFFFHWFFFSFLSKHPHFKICPACYHVCMDSSIHLWIILAHQQVIPPSDVPTCSTSPVTSSKKPWLPPWCQIVFKLMSFDVLFCVSAAFGPRRVKLLKGTI